MESPLNIEQISVIGTVESGFKKNIGSKDRTVNVLIRLAIISIEKAFYMKVVRNENYCFEAIS